MSKKSYSFNEYFNMHRKENKAQVANTKDIINRNDNTNRLISMRQKFVNTKEKLGKYYKLKSEIGKLTDIWKEIMAQTGTYNEQFLTFTLSHIKKEISFGWSCRIYVPYGLSFNILEKIKPIIENNLSCIFFYQEKKCQNFVMAKFVTEGFRNTEFTIPKINPFQVYIGNEIDSVPAIVDLRKFPHIMISGANGSGKSRLLDCMITTSICNCNDRELHINLVQLAKNDLVIYEDAIQCKSFCDDLKKTNMMLEKIISIMDERSQLIRPLRKKGLGSDISDYNRLNFNNRMAVEMIIIDEYASITDTSNNDKQTKQLKQQIIGKIERIAQYGRALGCFLCVCLQRPTAQMLSPFVKSQSNLKISGKQNNQKSSEVAMDDPYVALNLEERVFVYKTFDYNYIKTPYIDDKIILNSIKPCLIPNHKTLFDTVQEQKIISSPHINKEIINSVKNNDCGTSILPIQIKNKVKSKVNKDIALTFDKVDPIKLSIDREQLMKNISKIPNFVPYNPNNSTKVIDHTKIDLSKSQKPIKKKEKDSDL